MGYIYKHFVQKKIHSAPLSTAMNNKKKLRFWPAIKVKYLVWMFTNWVSWSFGLASSRTTSGIHSLRCEFSRNKGRGSQLSHHYDANCQDMPAKGLATRKPSSIAFDETAKTRTR
uniref:RH69543p n=1 Tax=Drosophila melanogaster TaxID=7227 RepID=Q6AWR3_DROME|nr:RH69543p [Drosophila melanogaster]